jgi:hypothetical protein
MAIDNKNSAPWVNPAYSRVKAMQLAQFIPTKAFGVWNQIPRFFLFKVSPVMESSGAVVSRIRDIFSCASGRSSPSKEDQNRLRIQEEYGMAKEVQIELEKWALQFLFEEKTVGANAEALQCLRKGGKDPEGTWGKCDDYAEFVREFAEVERRKISESLQRQDAGEERRLKVQAYFAESDTMVGKKGQTYFEECWKGKDNDFQDVLHFETSTVLGENHESLGTLTVLKKLFYEAKRSALGETPHYLRRIIS